MQRSADGEPDDRKAVFEVIIQATRQMDRDEELGISMIQVGSDPQATKFLKALDDQLQSVGAKFDICDTVTLDDLEDMSLADVLMNAIDTLNDLLKAQTEELDIKRNRCIKIVTSMIEDEKVEIRIQDNGVGMNPQVKQRLFDPFLDSFYVNKYMAIWCLFPMDTFKPYTSLDFCSYCIIRVTEQFVKPENHYPFHFCNLKGI